MITPLIDDRCIQLGLTVSPPIETDGLHWELSHLFLTENGSWDGVPGEFKPFQNDHLGGDHHVYMLGHRLGGERAQEPNLFLLGWPDGHYKFSPKVEHDWWGNAIINAGFDWQAGPGPYYGQMNALNTSVVRGIGLPFPPYPWSPSMTSRHYWDGETMVGDKVAVNIMGGLHTSFFLVFQEVEAYEPEPPVPPTQEQFQRVLDKAEVAADELVVSHELTVAAGIYLEIAATLCALE